MVCGFYDNDTRFVTCASMLVIGGACAVHCGTVLGNISEGYGGFWGVGAWVWWDVHHEIDWVYFVVHYYISLFHCSISSPYP